MSPLWLLCSSRIFALTAIALAVVPGASAASCESLSTLKLPQTSILTAEARSAGAFAIPGSERNIPGLPAFCRVTGTVKPTADSDIRFEVWLPSEGWNGKFLGVGNGGFAGTINFNGMADAVKRGYATASTDTGHQEADNTNANWALRHPDKVIDFGYRAVHETAEKAKAVMAAFYGERPRRSYFSSCSNGGRQALMEAQRFPGDFDGILAGAPANDWTHLLASSAWQMQALLGQRQSYIPAAKLPAIQLAVLAACDVKDGVKDGVLENPAQCRFDPGVLLCQGAESDACLTEGQVTALRKLYSGPPGVFPGYSPGGEAEPGGWGNWITGAQPEKALMYAFSTGFFRNIVFENPGWDVRRFDLAPDLKLAEEKAARYLNATSPNLSEFQKRGGKLILYHGWSDAAIPAQNAIHYFQSVQAKMGASRAEEFVRLYMVPGMQHCGGGSGPNTFGQGLVGHGDRQHDIEAALEAWVEQSVVPGPIVATKYKSDADPASGVVRTRPLCPYPQVARWKGTGSTDEAANFACAGPALQSSESAERTRATVRPE